MKNVEDTTRIAEFKYPSDNKFTITWLFDHSSCHHAFAEDALNTKKINVGPGGKQPRMHDTTWAGRHQKLVDDNGVLKGLRKVLEERGINTERMFTDHMHVVLANHKDFRTEKTLVGTFLQQRWFFLLQSSTEN